MEENNVVTLVPKKGAPYGNQRAAKKNRILTDCLIRNLVQNPNHVDMIARKLIQCAMDGEPWAMQLVHERVDGKVPQALIGENDEPLQLNYRVEVVQKRIEKEIQNVLPANTETA